jgi:benzoate membrane transport protein
MSGAANSIVGKINRVSADASFSAFVAGVVVVLVGMTSSAVLIYQAASSFGLDARGAGSWLGALCLAVGVLSFALSLHYRAPVLIAWSTPGAALLVGAHGAAAGISVSDAIGAFLFSAVLIALSGFTGIFAKIMNRIPIAIASALLGGVLLHFSLDAFVALKTEPALIGSMLFAYLLCKRLAPRWAMLAVLIVGGIVSVTLGRFQYTALQFAPTEWHLTMPTFSLAALLSIGFPLFIVTMASQNVTGFTIMRLNGYQTPVSPLMSLTGVANILIAPFGGFALNLAAITAAIAMGPESHPDRERRYFTGIVSGVFYAAIGLMATAVTSLFAAFPSQMVVAIAGFALLSTIATCLRAALAVDAEREAAFLTFVVAASGVNFFGLSSALWGLLGGLITRYVFSPPAAESK